DLLIFPLGRNRRKKLCKLPFNSVAVLPQVTFQCGRLGLKRAFGTIYQEERTTRTAGIKEVGSDVITSRKRMGRTQVVETREEQRVEHVTRRHNHHSQSLKGQVTLQVDVAPVHAD